MMKDNLLKIAILGDTGAGKTCFIAALQWLGEIGDPFHNVGSNGETKLYLDRLFDLLNRGELPEGSANTRSLSFSEAYVPKGRHAVTFDFEVQDYKGSDLGKLDDSVSLFQCWAGCDVLLVMVDIAKVGSGGAELRENLRTLRNVLTRPGMNAADKSLAIVLTQADKGGFSKDQHAPSDARAYIEENLDGFVQTVNEMGFKQWHCFALAALGVEPRKREDGIGFIPLSEDTKQPLITPFGYEELFDWLTDLRPQLELKRIKAVLQDEWQPWARPVMIGLAAAGMAATIIFAVLMHGWDSAKATATNQSESSDVRAKATWEMREDDRISEIESRIQEYEQALCSAGMDAEIRAVLKDWESYWIPAKLTESQRKRIDELRKDYKCRLEDPLFNQIVQSVDNKDDAYAKTLIARYDNDDLILRHHEMEVMALRSTLKVRERQSKKYNIANFEVGGTDNRQRMSDKIAMVRNFNDYPKGKEQDQKGALRAAEAMDKLMKNSLFLVEQIRVGTLADSREIYVKIATGVQSGCDLKDNVESLCTKKKADVTSAQWDAGEITNAKIAWEPGKTIRVEWRRNRFWGKDKMYAYYETKNGDWLGLLRMLIPKSPMEHPADHKNFGVGGPLLTIKCQEFENPQKDLELIEKYIHPGTYWTEGE